MVTITQNRMGSQEFADILTNSPNIHHYNEVLSYLRQWNNNWHHLGSGGRRMAFRGPDGLVYKKNRYENHDNPNLDEYRVFTRLKEWNCPWVPKFAMFNNSIIVMEYLENVQCRADTWWQPAISDVNMQRFKEINIVIADSGHYNMGIASDNLLYLRDGEAGWRWDTGSETKTLKNKWSNA